MTSLGLLSRPLSRALAYNNYSCINRTIISVTRREMTTGRKNSIPHTLRTAAEPRQNRSYNVRLSYIEEVNPSVRLLRLTIPRVHQPNQPPSPQQQQEEEEPFTFHPGQWLDVHIPSIPQAGGFTITSTPADAEPATESPSSIAPDIGRAQPYVELAVQNSPQNPPAAWLWRPREDIMGKSLNVRVGGSFVWPPPPPPPSGVDVGGLRNVVFVAGGVGINPLISILSHIHQTNASTTTNTKETETLPNNTTIHILYSTRLPKTTSTSPTLSTHTPPETILDQILFLPRLRQIIRSHSHSHSPSHRLQIKLHLFITDLHTSPNEQIKSLPSSSPPDLNVHARRVNEGDLRSAVFGNSGSGNGNGSGSESETKTRSESTVCYVCGPPWMTDGVVGVLGRLLGGEERVFYEKWW